MIDFYFKRRKDRSNKQLQSSLQCSWKSWTHFVMTFPTIVYFLLSLQLHKKKYGTAEKRVYFLRVFSSEEMVWGISHSNRNNTNKQTVKQASVHTFASEIHMTTAVGRRDLLIVRCTKPLVILFWENWPLEISRKQREMSHSAEMPLRRHLEGRLRSVFVAIEDRLFHRKLLLKVFSCWIFVFQMFFCL